MVNQENAKRIKWNSQVGYARTTVIILLSIVLATIGLSSLPVSVHSTGWGDSVSKAVTSITPQGWGFFTKDPREPFVLTYLSRDSGIWQPSSREPNAQPRNIFGLNRESRLDEYDLSQVTAGAKLDELWVECTGKDIKYCATFASETKGWQLWSTTVYDQRLCGRVLLIRQELLPLDFAGLDFDPKKEAIVANVTCNDPGGVHD